MGIITKEVWKCDVCGHEWMSRDNVKPLRCANCKTPYWDKMRKTKVEQSREAMRLKKKRRSD